MVAESFIYCGFYLSQSSWSNQQAYGIIEVKYLTTIFGRSIKINFNWFPGMALELIHEC